MGEFFKDNKTGFLCYKTDASDIQEAERIYQESFANNNSLNGKTVYARKESRIAGILGEIVFGKYMGNKAKYVGRGDVAYDFETKSESGKTLKIDVKCKYRTVLPKADFEASMFNYQNSKHFDSNFYVFLSTMGNFEYVWFCALSTKEHFVNNKNAVIWRKGETDPSNHKTFHEDTISVLYKYLSQFPS